MKLVKKFINNIFSLIGYKITKNIPTKHVINSCSEIHSKDVQFVRMEVFKNLVNAYEIQFNGYGNELASIKPNSLRPFLLSRLLGTPPSEAYFLIQALAQTESILGDVCEFGVAQGETSALIANEIVSYNDKCLHLFDSFEGLPKPTEKDKLKDDIFALGDIGAYTGKMKCPEDMVVNRLGAISFSSTRYVIHKGFIENIIYTDKSLPNQVSFAYVDFDFYEPIKIALNFLNSIVSPGAIIIIDDYDFFSTGVKDAVDEFVNERNSKCIQYNFFVPDHRYGYFAILTRK